MKTSALLVILPLAASAAVPLRWTVETSRVQPAVFEAYHGETLDLEATMLSYGRPFTAGGEPRLYWQTNGMGAAYWSAPATAVSNRLAAAFTPACDTGANVVQGFIGVSGSVYRAAFTLRFRNSPGADPVNLPLPAKTLDFATVTLENVDAAPFETKAHAEATYQPKGDYQPAGNYLTGEQDPTIALTNRTLYVRGESIEIGSGDGGGGGLTEENDPKIALTNLTLYVHGESITLPELMPGGEVLNAVNAASAVSADSADTARRSGESAKLKYEDSISDNTGIEFDTEKRDGWGAWVYNAPGREGEIAIVDDIPDISDFVTASASNEKTTSQILAKAAVPTAAAQATADSALTYAQGVYRYQQGNTTNCWFECTNYVVNAAEGVNKFRYVPEGWEDSAETPPSLQLWEIRDGVRQKVCDQRDWTVYYWNFKSAQLSNNLARATGEVKNSLTNYMRRGWANYTAVNGLDNPDPSTLWVDTEKVTLMAGTQWEKLVESSGCSYYTIVANGITLSTNNQTEAFLTVKDFEGNSCLTFRKTSSYLVYLNRADWVRSYFDSDGMHMFISSDAQPTAEICLDLRELDWTEEGVDCPATVSWNSVQGGGYECVFKLKPGIQSNACFARFKVLREGENIVEYSVPIQLNGGITFQQDNRTYKIRPSVSGSTVTWSVVP